VTKLRISIINDGKVCVAGTSGAPAAVYKREAEILGEVVEQAVNDEGVNSLPLSDMTVAEIEQAVNDEDISVDTLVAWMEEEKAGKNRAGVIAAINARLKE